MDSMAVGLRKAFCKIWSGPVLSSNGCSQKSARSIFSPPRSKEPFCPIHCLIKASIFLVIATFVLYLPLGDPQNQCHETKAMQGKKLAMCCLCDLYLVSAEAIQKTVAFTELMLKIIVEILYDLKLKLPEWQPRIGKRSVGRPSTKWTDDEESRGAVGNQRPRISNFVTPYKRPMSSSFYTLLDKIDRDDLCRTICCQVSTMSRGDTEKKVGRRSCKCSKRCAKLTRTNE